MSFGESLAPLLGRWAMAWFFLSQAYHYGLDWNNTAILLSMKSVPVAPALLLIVLACILLGSISLLLGFFTRSGAAILLAITVGVTITLHDYWHIHAVVAREADYDIFVRNAAIAGGLLILIGMGPGRFGIDTMKSRNGGGKSLRVKR
jgi:putative oxidoreductase